MLTTFAHAGHSHESMEGMSAIDHCIPVIIGAGVIIAILLAAIIYLVTTWQPKTQLKPKKKSNKK